MKSLSEIDVYKKRVFLRGDLDIPVESSDISTGNLVEVHNKLDSETATRLTNLKESVDYLLRGQAKQVVIAGHIGRPQAKLLDGKPVVDPALSTKNILEQLKGILKVEIGFCGDFTSMAQNQVILFENLRFFQGEVENDTEFAKKLASMADIYINDAFGVCHRKHASMVALPALLPHAAGLHLEEEVRVMTKLLEMPARPFVSIVGGAKIETKLPVIENLSKISHNVLIGGELPIEIEKTGKKFSENVLVAKLDENKKDISLESASKFATIIREAKTIIWNGPMGLYEEGFDVGNKAIANAILESGAYSVVGGGETTQFLEKHNLLSRFSFVSAGGGAMLEYLAGKELPGILALE